MQTFTKLSSAAQPSAVALGYFDGVHRGHRRVLSGAVAERENGLAPVCLTFAESPKSVISGANASFLMTREDKLRVLDGLGIERTYLADFREMMHLSARDFFFDILIGKLKARALFCGFNYRFGRDAAGGTALLRSLCAENGIKLSVVPPETDNGEVICSTLIKRLIAQGNIARANRLLCGRFGMSGVVRHGRHLGHKLGTPTINLPLEKGLTVPKFGVYVSEVTLESGERFCGVTNIGIKPTVGGTSPLWETWMPQYSGEDIYGQTADVRLLDFLREERSFNSLEALREEILRNGEQAERIYLVAGC